MIVNGPLDIAGLEPLTTDPVAFLWKGRVYFNTVSNVPRVYNGTLWENIATATGGGGHDFSNLSVAGITVGVGSTHWHPNLTIDTGDTYTINGRLLSENAITVDGTLTVNGTCRIL